MNELPLPIWFFLLYPLCWIVLFPALTLWSSLLYLAASRFDRNSLPPVLPRRPWLRLGVLAWVCHVGAAGCTLLLLLIPLSRFDFFFGFPGSALAALPGFCLSLWLGDRLMEWYALPGTGRRFRWSFLLLTAPWVLFLPPVTIRPLWADPRRVPMTRLFCCPADSSFFRRFPIEWEDRR